MYVHAYSDTLYIYTAHTQIIYMYIHAIAMGMLTQPAKCRIHVPGYLAAASDRIIFDTFDVWRFP